MLEPRFALRILFLVVLVTGCNNQSSGLPDPKLAPDDAVAAAESYLSNRDIDLSLYKVERVGFDYVSRTWHISYEGTRGLLHDYYWVKISDDDIREIEISGR